MALAILTLLPHCLLGKPEESSPLLQRVKRGWVWNQFFVLEEYTGLEPLYIGKVSAACMSTQVQPAACRSLPCLLLCITFLFGIFYVV